MKNDLLEGLGLREESAESQESDEFEATPKQLPKKENSAEKQVDGNSSEQLGGTESQESEEVESISRPMIRHPTRKKKKKKENSAENQVDENSSEQLGGTKSQESEEVEPISRPIIQHATKKKFKNDNSALYPDTDRLVGTDFQISDELEQTSGEEDYAENQVDGKSDEPLGNTESQKLHNYPQCQS